MIVKHTEKENLLFFNAAEIVAINAFVQMVEDLAEKEIRKSGKLGVAHFSALKTIQNELNNQKTLIRHQIPQEDE